LEIGALQSGGDSRLAVTLNTCKALQKKKIFCAVKQIMFSVFFFATAMRYSISCGVSAVCCITLLADGKKKKSIYKNQQAFLSYATRRASG
jgi:hypothetical protein